MCTIIYYLAKKFYFNRFRKRQKKKNKLARLLAKAVPKRYSKIMLRRKPVS
jgi:hypothetical protein